MHCHSPCTHGADVDRENDSRLTVYKRMWPVHVELTTAGDMDGVEAWEELWCTACGVLLEPGG